MFWERIVLNNSVIVIPVNVHACKMLRAYDVIIVFKTIGKLQVEKVANLVNVIQLDQKVNNVTQ